VCNTHINPKHEIRNPKQYQITKIQIMKQLIIFIGLPAGGKTSTAYKLAEKISKSKVIEVDRIKKRISGSVFGKNDAERELWFKEINRQIKEGLKKCDCIIIDEGFFARKYLNKILKGVEDLKKTIVEINYDIEEHIRRNKQRDGASGPVRKMYNLWNNVSADEKILSGIKINDKTLSVEDIIKIIYNHLTN